MLSIAKYVTRQSVSVRHALALVSGNVVQAGVGFLSNLVLVRYIAPAEFGRYAITAAVVCLVFSICSLRIGLLVIRAKDDDFTADTQSFFFSAIVYENIVGTLASVLFVFAFGLLNEWAVWMVLITSINQYSSNVKSFFERGMPYRRLAFIETVTYLVGHLLAVALVILGSGEITLYIRDLTLAVLGVLGLYLAGGATWFKLRWIRFREWRHLLRQSRGNWLDQAMEGLFGRLVVLLAGWVGGEKGAGIYFQAQRLAGVPHQLLTPVVSRLSLNWFSRETDFDTRRRKRSLLLVYMSAPLVVGALLAVALSDWLVPVLFGKQWSEVAAVLVMMAGAMVFMSLFEILKVYCYAASRGRALFFARLAEFGGLLMPFFAFFTEFPVNVSMLALGYSLAYAFGFLTLMFLLGRNENTAGSMT
ncbi:MAG: hypothetical protein FIA96_07615 [Betaproteobacteria bacterium]|nr:hypothetical protein [Betaproteobacteria bacterium]